MLDIFVAPPSSWRPPAREPKPSVKTINVQPQSPDWRDHAAAENWEDAILGYLREDWRTNHRLWKVINTIVAESQQQSRFDVRAATFECLQELMRLRRERKVFRYRREWIAILDPDLVVPLLKPRKHGQQLTSTRRLTAPGPPIARQMAQVLAQS